MTRKEWLAGAEREPMEVVFRIARGCENCGFYVPSGDGKFVCRREDLEKVCRAEHEAWLEEEME